MLLLKLLGLGGNRCYRLLRCNVLSKWRSDHLLRRHRVLHRLRRLRGQDRNPAVYAEFGPGSRLLVTVLTDRRVLNLFSHINELVIIWVRRSHHRKQDPNYVPADVKQRRCDAAPKSDLSHPFSALGRLPFLDSVKFHPTDDRRRNSCKRPAADKRYDREHKGNCSLLPCSAGGRRLTDRLLGTDRRSGRQRRRAILAEHRFGDVGLVTFRARFSHDSRMVASRPLPTMSFDRSGHHLVPPTLIAEKPMIG